MKNPTSEAPMNRKHLFLVVVLAVCVPLPSPVRSEPPAMPPPCSSPEARAFDFWIGKWIIREKILSAEGSWLEFAARTDVGRALDGCALVEHWEGTVQFFWEGMTAPEPMKGLSVRSWDPDAKTWTIWWMDSRKPVFNAFRGGFDGDTGTFIRDATTHDGRPLRARITFVNAAPDSVNWSLAVSTDAESTWTRLWVMEMRREK